MEPPPPVATERENFNAHVDPVKEKRKRRSSILKKRRSSNSPSRTPLEEQDGNASPSRKKRNLGERERRRVSFSKAPEVREFPRDPKTGFPPAISPLIQPIAGIESLLEGNLMINCGQAIGGDTGGLQLSAGLDSNRNKEGRDEWQQRALHSPAATRTMVGPVDMSVTCVPFDDLMQPPGAAVVPPTGPSTRTTAEVHDMSLSEVCPTSVADDLPTTGNSTTATGTGRRSWAEGTCRVLQDMETTCAIFDSDAADMEMTCRDMDATCRQMDSDSEETGSSEQANLSHDVLGFLQSLQPSASAQVRVQDPVPVAVEESPPSCTGHRQPVALNNATMTCLEHVDMSQDESMISQIETAPAIANQSTGASLHMDMMSLSEDGKVTSEPHQPVATEHHPIDIAVKASVQESIVTTSTPPESATATPQAGGGCGGIAPCFDETMLGPMVSTPIAGKTGVELHVLEETIIRPVDNLPLVIEGEAHAQQQEVAACAAVSAPTVAVVTDSQVPTAGAGAADAFASMGADGIDQEQPPSLYEISELTAAESTGRVLIVSVEQPVQQVHAEPEPQQQHPHQAEEEEEVLEQEPSPEPLPNIPIVNMMDCVAARSAMTDITIEFPEDLVCPAPFHKWTCSQKLFCQLAGQPFRDIMDYGVKEIMAVNSRLNERISSLGERREAVDQALPEKVADAHAEYFVTEAELEPCGFQTSLLNRFSQQMTSSQEQLVQLLENLSAQCGRIDEALQSLTAAAVETEDACQRLQSCQVPENDLKRQAAIISEVKDKYSQLAEGRAALDKGDGEKNRLINEKDELQRQSAEHQAIIDELVAERQQYITDKEDLQEEIAEAEEDLLDTCKLQEWKLIHRTARQAKFSFLCDSVTLTVSLEPPQTLEGVETVVNVEFDQDSAEPDHVWQKDWSDFAAVLFLDAVEEAEDSIVSCRTARQVLDLLSPLATAARVLTEQCWIASLYLNINRDVDARTVSVVFFGAKPLHRFTVTFRLLVQGRVEARAVPELVTIAHDFGPIKTDDVNDCVAKVAPSQRWLLEAIGSIHLMATGTALPCA